MLVLCLLQPGLSTEEWAVSGLAFLTRYDILAVFSLARVLGFQLQKQDRLCRQTMLCLWDSGPIRRLGALVWSRWLVGKVFGADPRSHFSGWWRIVNDYKALKMYMLASFQHYLKTITKRRLLLFFFSFVVVELGG